MEKKKARRQFAPSVTLAGWMQEIIRELKQAGQIRTGETYTATLHSFMRFRQGRDLALEAFSAGLMADYESYLLARHLSLNTVSFYMRILRAAYNRAVAAGLVGQCHPFRRVYTGIAQTRKRALPFSVIKQLKECDLSDSPQQEYARQLFLFSFYMRGMSFVDMAHLRKSDLRDGVLTYRRHKTGQLLSVGWKPCMQQVVDRYSLPDSPYLLPILPADGGDERRSYRNAIARVNRHLQEIGRQMGLSIPLTLYVARHSWASVARSRNIPLTVISEGLGHHSELTTQIYLASLDTACVDEANNVVLEGL